MRERVAAFVRALRDEYPDVRCELDFTTQLELLVATVPSARCTDPLVNKVTPGLFANYPAAQALAGANMPELEDLIRPTGFFRQKAATVQGIGRQLCDRFGGEVPARLDDLAPFCPSYGEGSTDPSDAERLVKKGVRT